MLNNSMLSYHNPLPCNQDEYLDCFQGYHSLGTLLTH